jgi:hypothetical protein
VIELAFALFDTSAAPSVVAAAKATLEIKLVKRTIATIPGKNSLVR